MTPQYSTDGTNCADAKDGNPRISLSCDDSGRWTLAGHDSPACQFPDFEVALDEARQAPDAQRATIEVWRAHEYICCLPPGTLIRTAPIGSKGRFFASAERYANRVAEVIFATAGPLFWLALMFVAVAASLGWRLFLL